jgi:hypothetical protein
VRLWPLARQAHQGLEQQLVVPQGLRLHSIHAPARQLICAAAVTSKPLLVNEAEQAVIHRMAAMRKAGMSLKAISDTLNAQGITTKLGKPWQCGSVDGVLNSRHTARLLQSQSESDQPALAA